MRAGRAKRRPSNSLRTRRSRYRVNPAVSSATVSTVYQRNRLKPERRDISLAFYLLQRPRIAAEAGGLDFGRNSSQVTHGKRKPQRPRCACRACAERGARHGKGVGANPPRLEGGLLVRQRVGRLLVPPGADRGFKFN